MNASTSEPTVELHSGQVIGHYELIEIIGRGGEAVVWSAWDAQLNQMVAFKGIPRSSEGFDDSFRFGREVKLLSHLEHPHILSVVDFGERPEMRYLISRYLPGGTLARRIRPRGAAPGGLSLDDTIRIGWQVAQAIDYLHSENVVHRDLKPSNVLFDLQNNAYLSDFGLARTINTDSTAPIHSQSGTLVYMPPEQFAGRMMSPASDQYSFGVTLFEMLTGVLPFDGDSALAIRQMNEHDQLPDVRDFRPEFPPRVTDLLRRMTASSAADRPATASDAIRELAEALAIALPTSQRVPEGSRVGEARALLDRAHTLQRPFLSATELVMVNVTRPDMTLDSADLALLLKSALVHNRDVEALWEALPDPMSRLDIAWSTWTEHEDTVPQLMTRILTLPTTVKFGIHTEALKSLVPYLNVDSTPDQRVQALALLERGVTTASEWQSIGFKPEVDSALAGLALADARFGRQAALLLAQSRSALGVRRLIDAGAKQVATRRLADVFNVTRSLPPGAAPGVYARVIGWLAARQLTESRREIAALFGTSLLSAAVCLGIVTYLTFNSSAIFSTVRWLNTFGVAALFGVFVGVGVFLARLIAARLLVLPLLARLVLSMLAGAAIIAEGFNNYHVLYLDARPRGGLIFAGSIVWAAGFALSGSVRKPSWQLLLAGLGMFSALAGTWYLSLTLGDRRPPDPLMYFEENNAASVMIVAAALAAVSAIGPVRLTEKTKARDTH